MMVWGMFQNAARKVKETIPGATCPPGKLKVMVTLAVGGEFSTIVEEWVGPPSATLTGVLLMLTPAIRGTSLEMNTSVPPALTSRPSAGPGSKSEAPVKDPVV